MRRAVWRPLKGLVVDTSGKQAMNTDRSSGLLDTNEQSMDFEGAKNFSTAMCCCYEGDVRLPLSKPSVSKCPACHGGCCKICSVSEFLLCVLLVPGCCASPCWSGMTPRSSPLHSVSQCWAHGGGNPLPVLLVTTLGTSHLTIFSLSFLFHEKVKLNYHLEYQHLTLFLF